MKIRLFGDVEIVGDDGTARRVTAAKPRALLCLLAIRSNQFVSSDQLADELWLEKPPPTATTALRGHIAALRKLLEPVRPKHAPSERILTSGTGYQLVARSGEIDIFEFERLATIGQSEVGAGRLGAALPVLLDAAALHQGSLFSGLESTSVLRDHATGAGALLATTLEAIADIHVQLGSYRDAISAARQGLRSYPLSDALVHSLAVSLAETGETTAALREISSYSSRLDRELGVPLPRALYNLERSILLEDPTIAARQLPTATALAPLPGPRSRRPGALVGRRNELAQLQHSLLLTRATRRLVLVTGQIGIGKSTLVGWFADLHATHGGRVLRAAFTPGAGDQYRPWADILNQYSESTPDSDKTAVEAALSALTVADRPAAKTDRDPAIASPWQRTPSVRQVADSVARALQFRTDETVIILLEDLHWSDIASLRVARHVMRFASAESILMVATLRSDEHVPPDMLDAITAIDSEQDPQRVELAGLDPEDVERLLWLSSPSRLHDTVRSAARQIFDLTAGNPFFVKEVARDLVEGDIAPERVASHLTASATAPSGVAHFVQKRLERLTPGARELLEVAAIVGAPVTEGLLAHLTTAKADDIFDALDEATEARFVTSIEDEISFEHDLMRVAIYGHIHPLKRKATHAAVAAALAGELREPELSPIIATRIAEHLTLAGSEHRAAAVDAARRASRVAISSKSFAIAVRWLEWLCDHDSVEVSEEQRAATAFDLARCYQQLERFDAMNEALSDAASRARAAGAVSLFVEIAIFNFGGLSLSHYRPDQICLIEEALTLVGDAMIDLQVQVLCARASMRYYIDPVGERDDAMLACQISANGSAVTRSRALWTWHRQLTHAPERLTERLAVADEMIALAHEGKAGPELVVNLLREGSVDLLQAGAIASFEQRLSELRSVAIASSSVLGRYHTLALESTYHIARGDSDLGLRIADAALDFGLRFAVPDADGAHLLSTFVVYLLEGRLREWRPRLARAVRSDGHELFTSALALGALACAETGQMDEARRRVQQLVTPGIPLIPDDYFKPGAVCLLAEAATLVDDRDACAALADWLLPLEDQYIVYGMGGAILGPCAYWLGRAEEACGQTIEAERHRELAVALATAAGFRPWARRAE